MAALARLAGCGGVDTTGVTSSAVVPPPEATLDAAANDRVVGIGEATHGDKEFVQVRLQVIKTLVERHGFRAVARPGVRTACRPGDTHLSRGHWHPHELRHSGASLMFAQETPAPS
ncbi:hypothetical protein [Planotetraspora silvatica]|uniref:hypothetical protein n=1 Tax=Planotetraspora silvatica TaxID=234614 RepID=UPI00194EC657|nr:hypothetical protein [Planotetraspora silvatica]